MGGRKTGISKKVRDASVTSVIGALKGGLKRGMSANVEECIDFVENNRDKVSEAYFKAARCRGAYMRRLDTEIGYEIILKTLKKEQMRYDRAYVTGFSRSGRVCFR